MNELETSLKSKAREMPAGNGIFKLVHPKGRQRWQGKEEIMKNLGRYDDKIMFLKGSSMYHKWLPDKRIRDNVTRKLRFNKCFRRYAAEFSKVLGPNYNALHIRMGDYYRHGRTPNMDKLFAQMKELGFRREDPLYIATEPKRDKDFFAQIEQKYDKVYYSSDFEFIKENLQEQFHEKVVNDMLGIIEQLVCMIARRFVGTTYSNFSAYIRIMRRFTNELIPELKDIQNKSLVLVDEN